MSVEIKGAAAVSKLDQSKAINEKELSIQKKNELSRQQPVFLELESNDSKAEPFKMTEAKGATANTAELAQIFAEQNKEFIHQWAKHNAAQNQVFLNHWTEQNLNSLSKVFEEKASSVLPNSARMPILGGHSDGDVNAFISKYNRIAEEVQKWTGPRKTRMLPFYLKDHTEAWFDSTAEIDQNNFNELTEALRQKFDSRSTKYRLRQ